MFIYYDLIASASQKTLYPTFHNATQWHLLLNPPYF